VCFAFVEGGRQVESASSNEPELWAAVANVREACRKGPGGAELRNGTKHFRGGAKVYVIDAFRGTCHTVTVIGQHRKSRKWMCLHMPAHHLENLRPKLVYSPTVQTMMREHYAASGRTEPPGREYVEELCAVLPHWGSPPAEPGTEPGDGDDPRPPEDAP
jgi:hypothetical protein